MNISSVATLTAERLQNHLAGESPMIRFSGQSLQKCIEGVPDWWTENGNVLYMPEGVANANLRSHPGLPPPTNAVVVIGQGSTPPSEILLWGNQPVVIISANCSVLDGSFNCGGESTIVLGEGVSVAGKPELNARNGGLICVEGEGLWSNRITMFTDDMHAILDVETGRRVNAYGGKIHVKRHVWLGFDVMLLPGTSIGADSIIGGRSIVNGVLPANSVCVGAPARPVRAGVTWSHEDILPSGVIDI